MLNPIAFAIPVFFAAIAWESWAARRRRLPIYRFVDSITDLSCGVGNQLIGLLFRVAIIASYVWVYDHWGRVRFAPGSPWPWVIGLLGYDFIYYWWHRFSHEINVLWAAHIVHHQSEDYNLAVALRQAWFTGLTGAPFYLVLALVGVHPTAFFVSASVSLLGQFWIHTELIPKLGPLEWVFNTPSHHRVHHATNPEYLDKNYGAILIVWDRLFGTLEVERAPCVYGITKPFGSFNPVWANFHYCGEIAALASRCTRWSDRLLAPFRPPGWDPRTRKVELPPCVPRESFRKFEPPAPVSVSLRRWVIADFVLVAFGVIAVLLFVESMPTRLLVAASAAIVLGTAAWGGLFERKPWATPVVVAHLVLGAVTAGWAFLA